MFRRSVALSIYLLERLCFTVFTVTSFGILGDFPSFRLLGFRGIFRRSAIPSFRISGDFPQLQGSKLTTNWSHMRLDFRLCT